MLAGTIVDATLRFDADWKRRYASQVATLDTQVANIRRVEAPDSVEDVHQAALELCGDAPDSNQDQVVPSNDAYSLKIKGG